MPGVLLDRFYVIPRHNGTDYISMSQIVEAVGVDARCHQNLVKKLPCGRLGQVAAIRMREHQVGEAAIVPCRPQRLPLRFLLFLVLLQYLEDRRSGSNRAGLGFDLGDIQSGHLETC